MVTREIDNELILMPIYKTNKEINEMYTMNETAQMMWNEIDGKATLAQVLDSLTEKFDKTKKEVIQKDLEELVKDLMKIKAII